MPKKKSNISLRTLLYDADPVYLERDIIGILENMRSKSALYFENTQESRRSGWKSVVIY